jgi:hypothetical protein
MIRSWLSSGKKLRTAVATAVTVVDRGNSGDSGDSDDIQWWSGDRAVTVVTVVAVLTVGIVETVSGAACCCRAGLPVCSAWLLLFVLPFVCFAWLLRFVLLGCYCSQIACLHG